MFTNHLLIGCGVEEEVAVGAVIKGGVLVAEERELNISPAGLLTLCCLESLRLLISLLLLLFTISSFSY